MQTIISALTPGLSWIAIRKKLTREYEEEESEEIVKIQYNTSEKYLEVIPRHPTDKPKVKAKKLKFTALTSGYKKPVDQDNQDS